MSSLFLEELAAMDLEKQIQKREMDMKETEKAPGQWFSQFITQKFQGLLNVPFWVYWTSPYSSHLVDHIPNGWVMFNGDMTNDPEISCFSQENPMGYGGFGWNSHGLFWSPSWTATPVFPGFSIWSPVSAGFNRNVFLCGNMLKHDPDSGIFYGFLLAFCSCSIYIHLPTNYHCTIFWANYSDLPVTSLESWLERGIIPMKPFFRLVNHFWPDWWIINNDWNHD